MSIKHAVCVFTIGLFASAGPSLRIRAQAQPSTGNERPCKAMILWDQRESEIFATLTEKMTPAEKQTALGRAAKNFLALEAEFLTASDAKFLADVRALAATNRRVVSGDYSVWDDVKLQEADDRFLEWGIEHCGLPEEFDEDEDAD